MTDTIIKVEGVGKKYRIRHRQPERYTALARCHCGQVSARLPTQAACVGVPPAVEDFWALKDVSFEVKRGEVIGIIGRNGAGKTTLLKILSRITEPTEGRVELDGRVASLLEVGTGFHPELTGRENIYLNGAILGMSAQRSNASSMRSWPLPRLRDFLDTPVKRYSSGMYVRLSRRRAAFVARREHAGARGRAAGVANAPGFSSGRTRQHGEQSDQQACPAHFSHFFHSRSPAIRSHT